jgi:small nuclear ribonucleoprotein (snRNP)-like protein
MRRRLWLSLAAVVILGLAPGCSKRVPLELVGNKFDPSQNVVVTFQDGTQLTGKIAQDSHVQVVREGAVYRGTLFELTLDEIRVVDAWLVRRSDARDAEWERVVDTRHDLGEPTQEFLLRIDQVKQVERTKVDPMRTATQSLFWTLTGAISAFLLADRS